MADLIPVIRGHMGGRDYYIGKMTFQELNAKVQFFSDLHASAALDERLQRKLGTRVKEMTEYLVKQSERFYGSIIVASWGGHPQYQSVKMEDHPLLDDDFEFGLLKFDGRQEFFALDGQHRLQSIMDAIKEDRSLRAEEVSVLFVTHERTEEGNVKTRRLFHTLNRYAKKTTSGEDITLDEDNVISIVTRMILSGGIKSLGVRYIEVVNRNIRQNQTDKFTSLAALYDCHNAVLNAVYFFPRNYLKYRPDESHVEHVYAAISSLWLELRDRFPEFKEYEAGKKLPGDFREPGEEPSRGNLLFRPIGLGVYGTLIAQSFAELEEFPVETGNEIDPGIWKTALDRIDGLPLTLGERPWRGTIFRNESMDTTKKTRTLAVRLACYMLGMGHIEETNLLKDYRGHLEDDKAVLPGRLR